MHKLRGMLFPCDRESFPFTSTLISTSSLPIPIPKLESYSHPRGIPVPIGNPIPVFISYLTSRSSPDHQRLRHVRLSDHLPRTYCSRLTSCRFLVDLEETGHLEEGKWANQNAWILLFIFNRMCTVWDNIGHQGSNTVQFVVWNNRSYTRTPDF